MGLAKSEGGMGLRCLKEFNISLLAKMCWQIIHQPDALWVQVLKGLYFPKNDFLFAKKGSKASWAWSSLFEGRKVTDDHARWQVLNGELIRTWSDRWMTGVPSGKLSASFLASSVFDPYQRVPDLIDWSIPSCWDLDPIGAHLLEVEQVAIMSIPLSSEWEDDKLIWPFERAGKFTVRSGYYKIHEDRLCPSLQHSHWSHSVNSAVWKLIWKIKAICLYPRLLIFYGGLYRMLFLLWQICLYGRLLNLLRALFVMPSLSQLSTFYSFALGCPMFGWCAY